MAQLPLQPLGFLHQVALRDRARQQNLQDAALRGLAEAPKRPQFMHDGNGIGKAVESGQDDRGSQFAPIHKGSQELESVHTRHHQVGEDGSKGVGFDLR